MPASENNNKFPNLAPKLPSSDRRDGRGAVALLRLRWCPGQLLGVRRICCMITPVFLNGQTNQDCEHDETNDSFFFVCENEHQLRGAFTWTDGKCPRIFAS